MEEELLLVDASTGAARSVASEVLRVARLRGDTGEGQGAGQIGGSLGPELQEQQLETDTPPEQNLESLAHELTRWREKAAAAAVESGALILASGTAPLPVDPKAVDDPRYAEMSSRFGLTATEQLTCGCHVHVSVDSDEEAVGALDRIRIWLPVLQAISTNSPFWQGADSGYESYRSQVLTRWPTQGPTQVFGSARAYREHLRLLIETGVPLDEGMAYFDARPSSSYPTLEVRAADVCLDPADAVLVAGLSRALVDTAAREWRDEQPVPDVPVSMLRLAMWQAGKQGLSGNLLDPVTHRPKSAQAVLETLLEHVSDALSANGDLELVETGLKRLASEGTGATLQRRVLAEKGSLDRAVVHLAHLSSAP